MYLFSEPSSFSERVFFFLHGFWGGRHLRSDLEAQFQQGQTVKSRIVSCDPEKRRVTLSLKTAPTSGNSLELLSKLSPGEIVSGVVTEATSDALQIRVADEENTASVQCLLPMEHLADTLDLAKRALKAYSPDLSGVPPPPLPKIEGKGRKR